MRNEHRLHFLALAKAKCRVRGQHLSVREDAGRAEAHQRQDHVGQLVPALDRALALDVGDGVRLGASPRPPGLACGIARLEYEVAAGTQRAAHAPQRGHPVRLVGDRLCDIRRHRREVDEQRRKRGRVTVNPPDALGARLGACDGERWAGRIDRDHLQAACGQQQGEGSGSTTDVEHAPGSELVGDRDVHVEVAAIRIERIVNRCQTGMLEDRVGHSPARRYRLRRG